ncbi:MAG TPA: hypothetical protein VN654_15900 [Vicinamibacterales bacterium]|nr:hypothetical protein [Vicinamibacterales bacterium]
MMMHVAPWNSQLLPRNASTVGLQQQLGDVLMAFLASRLETQISPPAQERLGLIYIALKARNLG